MKFYTDGSRIGKVDNFFIGWGAVCEKGVLVAKGKFGGSNINAEIFAIRDLLKYLSNKQVRILDGVDIIDILTDSKTSLQIINGYLKYPEEYNLDESENYKAADEIVFYLGKLELSMKKVNFIHMRGHGKGSDTLTEDVLGNAFADFVATQEATRIQIQNKEIDL